MTSVNLFSDVVHIKENMLPTLGAERAMGDGLYDCDLQAQSQTMVTAIRNEYFPCQRAFLDLFKDSELYISFSTLEDKTFSSEGAEGQVYSSVQNHIQEVEPQLMLQKVFKAQHKRVNEHKSAALRCTSPVPLHIEKHLSSLI